MSPFVVKMLVSDSAEEDTLHSLKNVGISVFISCLLRFKGRHVLLLYTCPNLLCVHDLISCLHFLNLVEFH